MITGWLLKVVLGIALLGVAVFEAGSPLITRVQVDDVAHRVADAAAIDYFESNDLESARAHGEEIARAEDVVITRFTLDEQGPLHVTVSREARSIVMHNFPFAKDWYDVSGEAASLPRRRDL